MSRRSGGRALSGVIVALALSLAPVGAATGAPNDRSAAPPGWHYLPSLDHRGHGSRLTTVGGVAGRAWFVVGSRRGLTIASARGRELASPVTTRIDAPFTWYPIFAGSDLLYGTSRSTSGIAPLLANGRVGPAKAATPEPLAVENGIPVAAVRLGNRLVWAVAGGVPIGEGLSFKTTLEACCDESGAPVDLSALITRRPAPRDHAIGVDRQGRVWLAWLDKLGALIVQLDPTTLERQTPKALVAPVRSGGTLRLACARACRLVLAGSEPRPQGGIRRFLATWAPGERSATRLTLPREPDGSHEYPQLLAADYRGERLAVAYAQDSLDCCRRTLKVILGDARGGRARLAGSVEVPEFYRAAPKWIGTVAAFTPSGLAFAQSYSGGAKVRVLATVVPLK